MSFPRIPARARPVAPAAPARTVAPVRAAAPAKPTPAAAAPAASHATAPKQPAAPAHVAEPVHHLAATHPPAPPHAPVPAHAAERGKKPPPPRAAAPVRPGAPYTIAERAPVSLQRLGISDALGFFADKANLIPGYRMLTIILGVNPINMSPVDRSAANILRALIEFIPGGGLITQALDNSGVFDKVGAWVAEQIETLAMTGSALKQAVTDFLGSLSFSDIFDLGGVWERAKRIFTEPIDRLIAFAKGLVTAILKFVKDAILLPLAKLAEGTKGWDLLIGVLGRNPITGDTVPRTPELLIGGFLKLIGQDEIWANMQKSNAIQKAWAWFQGALNTVVAFVSQIPELFTAAFTSLTIEDVVLVAGAFRKIAGVFGDFLGKFIDWAGTAIWNLLEIIFDVVSPGALTYVKKTGAALKGILKDPLPFVHNLVAAAKLGLSNFADNFGTHLKEALIDWLVGSLPGVYIPKAVSLIEFGKFALSVLGITWAQIRAKIVKALGPTGETIMKGLELAFDVVKALVTGGIGAAWELIKEKLTGLKDMVVDGIVGFITDTIVKQAIPKLVSLFVPGAGFITAIISIYNTIKVFLDKLAKIAAVVKSFVDSIVAIAGGEIAGAAARVESALTGVLSLAISFLAGFLGLGDIAAKVMAVVKKVQDTVDKALDTAITFIITKAKALFASLFGGGKPDDRTDAQKLNDLDLAIQSAEALADKPDATLDGINKQLPAITARYRLTSLTVIIDKKGEVDSEIRFEATINPKKDSGPKDVVTSKKRGDHVFALGIQKALQDMQGITAAVSNAALRQTLTGAISSGIGLSSSSPFSLVVDKGAQPASGDAHSVAFGSTTRQVVFAFRSYVTALERASTSQGTDHATSDSQMLTQAKSEILALLSGWVGGSLDAEAAALLPTKQAEIAQGQAALQQIAAGLHDAISQT